MKYLIIHEGNPFYSNHFDFENNYAPGMVVVNLKAHTFSNDGINFHEIEEDHL